MNGKIEARLSALNRGEILHYLGYSGQKIDSTLSAQIDRCAALVTKAAVPRLVWVRLPMEHKTVFDWESRDLESLLDDKSSGADAHSTDEETIDDNKQTRKE